MRCTLALVCVAIGVHDVDGQFFRTSCATWTDARAQCIAEGGDLVVIPDEDKNTVVTEFMQTFDDYGSCAGPYPWIGGSECSDGACTWVDNTPWEYTGPGFGVWFGFVIDDYPYVHFYVSGDFSYVNLDYAIGICEQSRTGPPSIQQIQGPPSSPR